MASILIQGGTILDPSQKLQRRADLIIRDGKIASIVAPNAGSASRADKVIDATGCFVTPGLIDIHTHAEEPCGLHADDGYDELQTRMAKYFGAAWAHPPTVAETAALIVALCTDDTAYMTGVTVDINGASYAA